MSLIGVLQDFIEMAERSGQASDNEFRDSVNEAEQYIQAWLEVGDKEPGDVHTVHRDSQIIRVYIDPSTGVAVRPEPSDFDRDTPSLTINYGLNQGPMLTWRQARALCLALSEVESIARRG